MRVMGVDLSTNTGVAIVDTPKEVIHAKSYSAPNLKGMPRINSIVGDILRVREKYAPDLIVIEDYAISKFGNAIILSVSLGSVLRFILWQDGHLYGDVAPSVVKKFLTGKGNAKKEHMMLDLYKKFGFSAENNDVADAVALALLGLAATQPFNFTKQQAEVATSLHDANPHIQAHL